MAASCSLFVDSRYFLLKAKDLSIDWDGLLIILWLLYFDIFENMWNESYIGSY